MVSSVRSGSTGGKRGRASSSCAWQNEVVARQTTVHSVRIRSRDAEGGRGIRQEVAGVGFLFAIHFLIRQERLAGHSSDVAYDDIQNAVVGVALAHPSDGEHGLRVPSWLLRPS